MCGSMCDKSSEYFKTSFLSVDGLWFLIVEDSLSFDDALKIDEKVWKIMPKIQSRKIRELYGIKGDTLRDLISALKIKFEIEGYKISFRETSKDSVQILIHGCPWFDIMRKARREALAGRVGERICSIEYQGWAESFNKKIKFSLNSQLCKKEMACELRFQQ